MFRKLESSETMKVYIPRKVHFLLWMLMQLIIRNGKVFTYINMLQNVHCTYQMYKSKKKFIYLTFAIRFIITEKFYSKKLRD